MEEDISQKLKQPCQFNRIFIKSLHTISSEKRYKNQQVFFKRKTAYVSQFVAKKKVNEQELIKII